MAAFLASFGHPQNDVQTDSLGGERPGRAASALALARPRRSPSASGPRCGRVAPHCMRKAVLTPRSNGHGILSLIDTLCAPLAFQYLLNDSHSDV